MRKFVFLILFVLGFAVCYAAPPPEPFEKLPVFTEQIAVDQSIDLPSVNPCIALQDQQPAPLLSNIPVYIMHASNSLLDEPENHTGMPLNVMWISVTASKKLRKPYELFNRMKVTAHSSGGMPY
ncbi:MAG TPA: hypothetical protein DCY35_03705 [Prolixibacteraceae bacterium]|nr:hypothetical protein [Prolixibacteraceae bacterium]